MTRAHGIQTRPWKKMLIPRNVIDVFYDIAYDPKDDDLLFVWQTRDKTLDASLPSGPVFAMKADAAKALKAVKEVKK